MKAVRWNAAMVLGAGALACGGVVQAHPSRGCSDPELAKSGGAGLLYCFAVN